MQAKKFRIFSRFMSTVSKRKFKEVKIPVPWGHLAGKYWGSENNQPIIALHAWQDNASSFDNLAECLPKNVSLFAFDYPGSGLSSWLPKIAPLSFLNLCQFIDIIKNYFEMDKVGLIGHSIGANASLLYASQCPENIKFVINLDPGRMLTYRTHQHLPIFVDQYQKLLKLGITNKSLPTYKEDELIKKRIVASRGLLDEESCKMMLERQIIRNPNGTVTLQSDPRNVLISTDVGLIADLLESSLKRVQIPNILVKATNVIYEGPGRDACDFIEIIERCAKPEGVYTVSSRHHLHITNAEATSEIINPFILKYIDT